MDRREYHTLDALRGVAALGVVVLHAEVMDGSASRWMPSAYLAVDLFFVLSGFVLDHAYRQRFVGGMGAGEFMRARYIRLYPLYALGVVIGLISAVAALVLGAGELGVVGLVIAAVAAMLLLPSPTWSEAPGVFPANVPGWSLFFELAVNLVFAATYRFLTRRVLALVIALSAMVLALAVVTAGHADLGSSWSGFWGGFPRVSFSFFAGVLLCRLYSGGGGGGRGALAWLLPMVLLPIFMVAPPEGLRPVFDLIAVLLVFPAIIALAARCEPGAAGARLFRWVGVISFPIYAIHYPVLELMRRSLHALHLDALYAPAMAAACVGLVIASWLLVRFYDEPMRAALTRWVRAGGMRVRASAQR
jgi:peptidoglycan/LPS O-acetylase OafA/YrhL